MSTIIDVRYSSVTQESGIQNNNEMNNLHVMEYVRRMVHDAASPLALLSMLKESPNLVNTEKDLIKHVIERFNKIIESFKLQMNCTNDTQQTISSSDICRSIQQIIEEKEIEYANSKVKFTSSGYCDKGLYISGCIGDFERMISNLLNNAVEAYQGKSGVVTVRLTRDDKNIILTIEDGGSGMPEEVLQKIRAGLAVTHGKENGSGIGMGQIRDTINKMQGKLTIESKLGSGSKFTLQFPAN